MAEEFIVFIKILISFFTVVGFIYLLNETICCIRYGNEKCRLPIIVHTTNYSHQEIFAIVKAFSNAMNFKSTTFILEKITIVAESDEEIEELQRYLGKYLYFTEIRKGTQ